jgi:hypothetical protein
MSDIKAIKEAATFFVQSLVVGVMAYGVATLGELNKNVALLNTQVAVLIQHNANVEKRVEKLESKVFNN